MPSSSIEEKIKASQSSRLNPPTDDPSTQRSTQRSTATKADDSGDTKFGISTKDVDSDVFEGSMSYADVEYGGEIVDSDDGSDDDSSSSNKKKRARGGRNNGEEEEYIDEGRLPDRRKPQEDDTSTTNADDPFKVHRDEENSENSGTGIVNTRISDRESAYQQRRLNRAVHDVDVDGKALTYKEIMDNQEVERERVELEGRKGKVEERIAVDLAKAKLQAQVQAKADGGVGSGEVVVKKARRRRWDTDAPVPLTTVSETSTASSSSVTFSATQSNRWDDDETTTAAAAVARKRNRWGDETPSASSSSSSSLNNATPAAGSIDASKWGETPGSAASLLTGGKKRSRWDATPTPPNNASSTSSASLAAALLISASHSKPVTEADKRALLVTQEMELRSRYLTDAELDVIFPSLGYKIMEPPEGYVPSKRASKARLLAADTPANDGENENGFVMHEEKATTKHREDFGISLGSTGTVGEGGLPFIKEEDYQYFGKLVDDVDLDLSKLSREEVNERRVMTLLLKIKSGTPPQRKTAMRQITDKARALGAGELFKQILPLLMSPTLEDQERHLLVKVIDRVLYKLDVLVKPYVHKILVVIEPLLIDEDYYARIEGREIISNLAKAAGLATMIATMRPDIDNLDEYVRNTTARAFAVVATALGVQTLLPFLKAVCNSKKSWQARHTGIKIIQQIALLMGCGVLPFLSEMVEIIRTGLTDDQQKVRTICALTLASLGEAAYPYGIEAFEVVLRPLWKGIKTHKSKGLAAFIKAVGFIIPLMEDALANHYTKEVMPILIREFKSPDEEMKKIVLTVIKQCVGTSGVTPSYIREEILPDFFASFWVRRMALDRRNYKMVVETTEALANKVGASDVISRVVDDLKDDSEPYRRMVMETVRKVFENLGADDIDQRLEERLVDGVLYAFQEQGVTNTTTGADNMVMLEGFGVMVNALGIRCKPYLLQIAGTIKWRMNNKAAAVRMQAADLIGRIAVVMKACNEDQLMSSLGYLLYEYLGEEYPEVLGSILGALKAIVSVIGMTKMNPKISDLLPKLTPILRNRHEKVQENCVDLVGRIASRGAEYVPAKEWMRICFELLEMLKAPKLSIRRASVATFGFIAKAIGPQDVLHTLLNNLKVQDRQNRVCTTIAIAIVAETCGAFTILPAIMNEYRVPELNIQNGVLKALSFMCEYIGDMNRDYIYAISPLLQDALTDRDNVHRQTACATVKHLSLGVFGLGCEDALIHLLNYVWPNIFEASPHVINATMDAVEGLMVGLGPNVILLYILQGLFHPARKVKEVYWRVYNMVYVYGCHSMCAGYVSVENVYVEREKKGFGFGLGGIEGANLEEEEEEEEEEGGGGGGKGMVERNHYAFDSLEVFI